jgi:hypothetical protein
MTIADFLSHADFFQWVGMFILASILAKGLAHFRLWGNVYKDKDQ